MIETQLYMMAAMVSAAELVIVALAGYTVFRRTGYTLSEAAAYAIMTTFFLLSCVYQTAFLFGLGTLSWCADIVLVVAAVTVLVRHHKWLRSSVRSVVRFYPRHRLTMTILLVIWIYLASAAFWIPAEPIHWPALNPILLLQHHNGFFSQGVTHGSAVSSFVYAPTNASILAHLFLRNHTDMGIGLLGLSAYMSIGFTTYALARRYAWPATALTVALIVISMPRCVYAASRPSIEIVTSATAVFCLLAIYRVIERPNIHDLIILVAAIFWLMSYNALSPVFPLILIALAAILLFRRHGTSIWWQLIRDNRWWVIALLPPMLILSQVWIILYNLIIHDIWIDPTLIEELVFNHDGLQGFGANLLRYNFENAHFTAMIDGACQWLLGFRISSLLQYIYDHTVLPLFGMSGAAEPFRIRWVPNEQLSWFGPFGCLLGVPAVGYALVRAPRRLKAVVVALLAYFIAISLILSWEAENVRFFSLFFVCSGVCMAFFLSPWRIARRGRRILQLTAGLLLLYACIFDQTKPVLSWTIPEHGEHVTTGLTGQPNPAVQHHFSLKALKHIRLTSHWTADPWIMARRYFGDHRVESVLAQIPADALLYLIYENRAGIYPFLLGLPRTVHPILLNAKPALESPLPFRKNAYLLYVDTSPTSVHQLKHHQILWQPEPDAAFPKGGLYHRN